jgi:hypothetical protein
MRKRMLRIRQVFRNKNNVDRGRRLLCTTASKTNMRKIQINRTLASGAMKAGAVALGAAAVGALAVGAAAVGALAIGVLTMRRLRLRKGRLGDIHIQRLTIGELDIQSRHGLEKP